VTSSWFKKSLRRPNTRRFLSSSVRFSALVSGRSRPAGRGREYALARLQRSTGSERPNAPSIAPAGASADAKLDAAEMQWRTKATATYEFTITFHEMIIREGCSKRQFHTTIAHNIPSRRTDCAVMRTTYSTVPEVFKEMRKLL
jgi:hypothetical protein